jgi:hypothetical protein
MNSKSIKLIQFVTIFQNLSMFGLEPESSEPETFEPEPLPKNNAAPCGSSSATLLQKTDSLICQKENTSPLLMINSKNLNNSARDCIALNNNFPLLSELLTVHGVPTPAVPMMVLVGGPIEIETEFTFPL